MYKASEIRTERLNNTYRKPNDEILKQIEEENQKIIVLYSANEGGKTSTLYNIENRTLTSKDKSIYARFQYSNIKSKVSELFLTHYHELTLSNILITYIEENYPQIYQNNFQEFSALINDLNEDLKNYKRTGILTKYLQTGELTKLLIERLKRTLEIDRLTILIDDYISPYNKNSHLSEEILIRYFNFFDKTIISSTLPINNLPENHTTIKLNYGENKETLKEIFKMKIETYLKKHPATREFPFEEIDEELLNYLIEQSQGNIGVLIRTLYCVYFNWKWDEPDFDIPEEFKYYLNEQLSHLENGLKLHL